MYTFTFINNVAILTINQEQKEFKVLFDRNLYNKIKNKKWKIDNKGYCYYINKSNKHILFHRLVVNCPKGLVVHHINQNTLDNRKENLKPMTICEHSHLHNPKKLT